MTMRSTEKLAAAVLAVLALLALVLLVSVLMKIQTPQMDDVAEGGDSAKPEVAESEELGEAEPDEFGAAEERTPLGPNANDGLIGLPDYVNPPTALPKSDPPSAIPEPKGPNKAETATSEPESDPNEGLAPGASHDPQDDPPPNGAATPSDNTVDKGTIDPRDGIVDESLNDPRATPHNPAPKQDPDTPEMSPRDPFWAGQGSYGDDAGVAPEEHSTTP